MKKKTEIKGFAKVSQQEVEKACIRKNHERSSKDKLIAIDNDTPFMVLMQDTNDELFWTIDFQLNEHYPQSREIPRIKISEYLQIWRCV